jgi:hypothetical protein
LTITLGNGGDAAGGNGGGAANGGNGGSFALTAGSGGTGSSATTNTGGNAGAITLTAGNGGNTKEGGDITLQAGTPGSSTSEGGDIFIIAGDNSGTTNAGDVSIYGGNASTTDGDVLLAYDGSAIRGRVGIGSGAPAQLLDVEGTAQFDFTTGNGNAGVCHSGGDVDAGSALDVDLGYCTLTASDYAEMYETRADVEAGHVVSTSDESVTYVGDGMTYDSFLIPNGAGEITLSVLKKTDQAKDKKVVGIISTFPQEIIGRDIKRVAQHPMPVALNGRVPVYATAANGPIMPGDYVTPAGDPAGYVMKLNSNESGPVVGIALDTLSSGEGKVMVFISRSEYNGFDIRQSGGEIMGGVSVTAAGTPLKLDLTGSTNVAALRNIFEVKLNGETKFNVLETGDATLSGNLGVGTITTIADAQVGGNLKLAQDLEVAGLVRLDRQGRLKNITSVAVTASVNADGSVTPGNVPATSVGAAVSVAQTSADPVAATRAALALTTAGTSSMDYLIYSEPFRVTYDGKVKAKSLELADSLTVGSNNLLSGTLVEGKVGDTFSGHLVKFTNTSGQTLFAVSGSGLLEADTVKTRAIVIDNADEPRASIGSSVVPSGATVVTVAAPGVKPGMKIFLTPKLAISQSLAVTDVQDGSFTVSLAFASASDVPFDWWLVDVTNPSLVASSNVTSTGSVPSSGTTTTSSGSTTTTTAGGAGGTTTTPTDTAPASTSGTPTASPTATPTTTTDTSLTTTTDTASTTTSTTTDTTAAAPTDTTTTATPTPTPDTTTP